MTIDATFWVAVSFFIFIGGLIYLKIPQKINVSLTNQISEIKKELNEAEKLKVFHFDLYRINSPRELEEIGIGEYLEEENSVCIFEWPENAQSLLPQPDYTIEIAHSDDKQLDKRNIRITL